MFNSILPAVNFINMLMTAFTLSSASISPTKLCLTLSVHSNRVYNLCFMPNASDGKPAIACKMLMKLTPDLYVRWPFKPYQIYKDCNITKLIRTVSSAKP
jgi:hypothetical protein